MASTCVWQSPGAFELGAGTCLIVDTVDIYSLAYTYPLMMGQVIWISNTVTSDLCLETKLLWLLGRNWISRANNGSKEIQESVAKANINYDDGLNFCDSSGSGENYAGCVLEVAMTGPFNECEE